jgi:hypothetical protein
MRQQGKTYAGIGVNQAAVEIERLTMKSKKKVAFQVAA